jgi:hypothetical protein
MTANQIILGSNICTDVIEDKTANATAQNNVTGAAATLFGAYIDNTLNSTTVYLKIWNHASPTVGTTAPDFSFACPAGKLVQYTWAGGVAMGVAISYACVAETASADLAPLAGGTAGTTSPAKNVIVRILVT